MNFKTNNKTDNKEKYAKVINSSCQIMLSVSSFWNILSLLEQETTEKPNRNYKYSLSVERRPLR